jgi:hypothetical protein
MTDQSGFSSPVVGGDNSIIREEVKSPDFVHGVSGWSIMKNGSAEFNDLVIRGVFNGSDFIINPDGGFFYDGAPDLGNLIASFASASGFDAFGNAYMQGITAYSASGFATPVNHAQLQDGTLALGPGVDFIHSAAAFINCANDYSWIFNSPVSVAGPQSTPLSLILQGGTPGATTGSANAMFGAVQDFNTGGPADWHVSGSTIATDNSGVSEIWNTGTYQPNWSAASAWGTLTNLQPLHWRKSERDSLRIGGCFTAAAAAGTAIVNVPAYVRPKATGQQPLQCGQRTSAGAITYGFVYLSSAGNLNVNSQFPTITVATGSVYLIPEQEISLGNVP